MPWLDEDSTEHTLNSVSSHVFKVELLANTERDNLYFCNRETGKHLHSSSSYPCHKIINCASNSECMLSLKVHIRSDLNWYKQDIHED